MFARFTENKSSTSIAYKRYEQKPEDKYPTFSICLEGAKTHSYNDSAIFELYGITSDHYPLMLEGQSVFTYHYNPTSRLYTKSSARIKPTSNVDFESMVQRTIEVTDILVEADFIRKGCRFGC